jgi:MFS family permease
MLTFAGGLGLFGVSGWQVHWIPHFQDLGFSAAQGAIVLTVYGVFTIPARFFWAFFSERSPIRYVLAAQALWSSLGAFFLLGADTLPLLYLWAAFLGMALGGFFQLDQLIMTDYFGRGHIGAIRGYGRPVTTALSTSAPLVLGALRDVGGSYLWAFSLVAATWFSCAALVFLAPPLQVQAQQRLAAAQVPAGGKEQG